MRTLLTLTILICAATLEAGGDALMRLGMQGARLWILAGAATLTVYGVVVNLGALNFSRLMGVYIVVFFVVSQVIAATVFRELPERSTIFGGALVIAGGALMML